MKTYKVTYNVVLEYEIQAEDEGDAQSKAELDFLPDLQQIAGTGDVYPEITVEEIGELLDDDLNDHD